MPRQSANRFTVVSEPDLELALQYAECRGGGHQWRHRKGFVEQDGLRLKLSTCSECKTLRTRYYTRSGQIFRAPTYDHPEGYSVHGDTRLTSLEWRQAWLVRELGEDLDRAAGS